MSVGWRERIALGISQAPIPDDATDSVAMDDIRQHVREADAVDPRREERDADAEWEREARETRRGARLAAVPKAMSRLGVPRVVLDAIADALVHEAEGWGEETPVDSPDLARRASAGESLWLHGPRGTGKSHLAAVALRLRLLAEVERLGASDGIGDLESEPKAVEEFADAACWCEWGGRAGLLAAARREAGGHESRLLADVVRAPWLALDDISSIAELTPFAVDVFGDVVRMRANARLPVVITSNLGPDGMHAMLARALTRKGFDENEADQVVEPIISRLAGMCGKGANVIQVQGRDRRLT